MFAAILAVALSQWGPEPSPGMQQYDPGSVCGRAGGRCFLNRSSNRPRENYAFFEFAPTSGAGMGTACACTTPTGAKGEAMTFTRTGNATCSKQGLATTGIADGDLVVCTANQPRVESSGGVLGLRVEGARTNDVLRSQQLENAVWLLTSGGAPNPGVPVVTANAATAPDGTVTADRLDFGSTTGTGFGVIYQGPFVSTAASWSHSVYVKGVSGSGTVYLMSTPGGSYNTSACAFVSTSWSRCTVTGTETATNWFLQIGYDLRDGAQTGQGAQSVYLWQAQREAGAYATSPIPTVAAAVTRNQDRAEFALAFSPTAGMCTAATLEYISLANLPSGGNFMGPILGTGAAGTAVTTPYWWPFNSAGFLAIDTTGVMSAGSASYVPATTAATSPGRYLVRHPGGVAGFTACTNAVCTTNGTTSTWGAPAFTRMLLDQASGAAFNVAMQHIVSRVQVDPSPTRCTQ